MSSSALLSAPVVEALGWALVHLLWQGALVAAILAAALSLLSRRSSTARYAAACIALASLPVLATITAERAYDPPPQTIAAADTLPITIEPATSVAPASATAPSASAADESSLRDLLAGARRYLPFVVLAWLAGVAFLATRLVISWMRVQRMARDRAKSAAAIWNAAVSRLSLALGLRRAVRLLESAAVDVPTVIGWLSPVILLPASTLAGLSPEQIEMLLAHELAHIRRHDFFINLLQALVETLMFYHPAVWWISQRVRIERENCCDDLAVAVCGNPVQYARALTRLEELRAGVQYAAVAANGGSLVQRIRRLIATPREVTAGAPRWAAGAAVLSVIVALIALPSLPLFAGHEQKKDEHTQATKGSSSEVDVTPAAEQPEAEQAEEPDTKMSDDSADEPDSNDTEVDNGDATPATPATPTAPAPPVTPRPDMAIPALPVWAPRIAPRPMAMVAPNIAQAVADGVAGAIGDIDVDVQIDDHDMKTFGASGKLTVDELIALRSQGVTPEYIQQMRAAALGDLSLGQILAMRVQGVTPAYIRDLR
ncbi:MAG: M56 family metallopeptidase, partial [Thermoanaerobaculia bacterium]